MSKKTTLIVVGIIAGVCLLIVLIVFAIIKIRRSQKKVVKSPNKLQKCELLRDEN